MRWRVVYVRMGILNFYVVAKVVALLQLQHSTRIVAAVPRRAQRNHAVTATIGQMAPLNIPAMKNRKVAAIR